MLSIQVFIIYQIILLLTIFFLYCRHCQDGLSFFCVWISQDRVSSLQLWRCALDSIIGVKQRDLNQCPMQSADSDSEESQSSVKDARAWTVLSLLYYSLVVGYNLYIINIRVCSTNRCRNSFVPLAKHLINGKSDGCRLYGGSVWFGFHGNG